MTQERARLLELADLVEAATGPDRELDRAVARAKGWHRVEPRFSSSKHGAWIAPEDFLGTYSSGAPKLDSLHGTEMHREVPAFTSSLDAALSLVPEGLVKNLGDDTGAAWAHVWKDEPAYDGMPFGARAVTLSLALTAACLRTLANQDDSK